MVKPWPLIDSKILQSFPIYRLRQDTRCSPRTGLHHRFLVLDSTDWVNIVPVTREHNVVMIKQFRHGTASIVLEIPGGMVEPEDQSPMHAATRELIEETGYQAEDYIYLGSVHPNPAIQNNLCHTFLAVNAYPARSQTLEGTEDIEVLEVPWSQIPRMIQKGEITHALVLVAFFWYQKYLEEKAGKGHQNPLPNPKK